VNPGDLILSWFPGWAAAAIFWLIVGVLIVVIGMMVTLSIRGHILQTRISKAARLAITTIEVRRGQQ
jgi:NAD/NADP transhydrogenase beta subunit